MSGLWRQWQSISEPHEFETGVSSLSLLRSLLVDELKIDESCIENLERDIQARDLVQSIIAIGKTHGMTLLAERGKPASSSLSRSKTDATHPRVTILKSQRG